MCGQSQSKTGINQDESIINEKFGMELCLCRVLFKSVKSKGCWPMVKSKNDVDCSASQFFSCNIRNDEFNKTRI